MKKNILFSLIIIVIMSSSYSNADDLKDKESLYAYLLSGQNTFDVKIAAKLIYYGNTPTQNLTDIAAEAFSKSCSNGQYDSDTRLWLARALSKNHDGRYINILKQCLTYVKKNTNHITEALSEMQRSQGSTSSTPYVPGSVNLTTTREHTTSLLKAKSGMAKKEDFLAVHIGDSFDNTLAKLSFPDSINSALETGTIRAPWPARIKISHQHLQLTYNNLGSIRIDDGDQGGVVTQVTPFINYASDDVKENPLHRHIMSTDNMDLILAARKLYNDQIQDEATLDIAATRLLRDKTSNTKEVVEGLSWLCKGIGQSKNSRYRLTLQKVLSKDSNGKLKKYAKAALKELSKIDSPQFTPSE